MRKIRDTITGLWPVIKPYVPKPGVVIALVAAFIVGLIWGYRINPIQYYDTDPAKLQQSWQDEWVRLLADRYRLATTNAVATDEFNAAMIQLLGSVDNPLEITQRLGLAELQPLAAQADPGRPAPQPNLLADIQPFVVGSVVVALVAVFGSLIFGFYINPMVIEPIRRSFRKKGPADQKARAELDAIHQAREMKQQLQTQTPAASDVSFGPPVVRHVSIYFPGRAYDDSFSIEDENRDDEFLGECGVTISETIGTGEPEKVTAVEVWLFDKDDFVRTLTGVFVSEYAASDPAIRSKLEPKGQLVAARPGAVLTLETNNLRLQARIVDMSYGAEGGLPPNSYFSKLSIELLAWRREAASVPAGVAMTPAAVTAVAPTYAPAPAAPYSPPPQTSTPIPSPFAPPPSAPAQAPSYGGGNFTPLRPAPLQAPPTQPPQQPPPRRRDDDPFGGTGDWTPLG
jgi:hypothetical protein